MFCNFDFNNSLREHYYAQRDHVRYTGTGELEVCTAELIAKLASKLLEEDRWDILRMTPCDIWELLKGRRLWVVGDSQALDLFKALECFLSEFWTYEDWSQQRLEAPMLESVEQPQPSCLGLLQDTTLCFIRISWPEQMLHSALPFILGHGTPADLLVMNFGLHSLTVEGTEAAAAYLKAWNRRLPLAFWKDVSAQHFQTATGAYEPESNQKSCVPLAKNSSRVTKEPVVTPEKLNAVSVPIFQAAGSIIVSDIELTEDLWEYHRTKECTHFCFPSAPQIWVHTLFRCMLKHRHKFRPLEEA